MNEMILRGGRVRVQAHSGRNGREGREEEEENVVSEECVDKFDRRVALVYHILAGGSMYEVVAVASLPAVEVAGVQCM